MTAATADPSATTRRLPWPSVSEFLVAAGYLSVTGLPNISGYRFIPVLLPLLLLAALFMTRRGSLRDLDLPLPALGFLAWCAATIAWSDNRALSVMQLISSCLVVTLACLLRSYLTRVVVLRGLALGGAIALLLGLISAVLPPHVGISPSDIYGGNSLQGLYAGRNVMAQVLILPFLAAVCAWPQQHRLAYSLALATGFAAIAATTASTALVTSIFGLGVALVVVLAQRLPSFIRVFLIAGAAAGLALAGVSIVSIPARVLEALGRDATLTGRTDIWRAVHEQIATAPVIGHGWGATWGPGNLVGDRVSAALGFTVPNAHSGFLDALVQAGSIGLALLLLLVLALVVSGVRGVVGGRRLVDAWPLVLSAGLLVYSLDEPLLVAPIALYAVVLSLPLHRSIRLVGPSTATARR